MTYFTYNGRSSAYFGLHIEKKDVFSAPEYDAEFISIPGRSASLRRLKSSSPGPWGRKPSPSWSFC